MVNMEIQLYRQVYRIPLTQGQYTTVSAVWFWFLMQWKWFAMWSPHTNSYRAARKGMTVDGRQFTIWMHRVIMNAPDGVQVDHKNVNSLDNTEWNLRLATSAQNRWNRGIQSYNNSGYKGVCFHKRAKKYMYQLTANGKRFTGYRDTALEAYEEYCRLAKIYHGDFANFG